MPIVKYVEGDLITALQFRERVPSSQKIFTAHGCNCQNKMGSGYAPLLAQAFPNVFEADSEWYNKFVDRFHRAASQLGTFSYSESGTGSTGFYNLYTQFYTGKALRLDALRLAFRAMNDDIVKQLSEYFDAVKNYDCGIIPVKPREVTNIVTIPLIGAGIAGGIWSEIAEIIDEVTPALDVMVWHLPGQKPEGV